MSKYYRSNAIKAFKSNSKNNDNIQMLANAIVLQAAKDYRELCRKIEKNPNNHEIRREIKMIEDFFSEWWRRYIHNRRWSNDIKKTEGAIKK